MTDILDNANVIAQRDPEGALAIAASQPMQAAFDATVLSPEHDDREIKSVVITGMGGSALSGLVIKVLLQSELSLPLEIVREYDLPGYVNQNTLVIASSYSGNTEETLTALEQAKAKSAQIAHVIMPTGVQPRMAMIYSLKSIFALLVNFGVVSAQWLTDLENLSGWLEQERSNWLPEVPTERNYAKQLALETVGKSPVFYGSPLTAPLAYKWKISWNETSKNTAFWNEYPEFNHNEFMGWTSHPVEKPFVVFDLKSPFDRARILQRFELSDRLLSGKRPQAKEIQLMGDSLLAQMVWGAILADFASIYTAILNGVDPTPVVLIEKLKQELASDPR